jgi:16S rRNA (cytosine967-C5)-methyltransferase
VSESARGLGPVGPTARGVAARVVQRVLEDGAFVSDALDAELDAAPRVASSEGDSARRVTRLDARDRALATELCYGVIRTEPALAERLSSLARRGLGTNDPLLRAHLLVAAYQLLVLDRIPAFAAINEAVTALRRLRGSRVAGFANAILRKLAASGDRLSLSAALEGSVAPWLFAELCRSVGREPTLGLLGASLGGARRGLSVRLTARADPSQLPWLARAEPGKLVPSALWLPPSGDLRLLAGYREGAFVVQEEGAQWAAHALGTRPGERVLDACAGHGQKSSLIAEQLGSGDTLWVNDVAESKLERLRHEFDRLGLPAPHCHLTDLTRSLGELPSGMDRVLVDAPCTGTGTLRRRPEILRRLRPDDPERLAQRAALLLVQAAKSARPGGRVLFVVCSVLRTECEDVAERVREVLEPAPFDSEVAAAVAGAGAWQCRLLPSVHGTDGYYVASFATRASA